MCFVAGEGAIVLKEDVDVVRILIRVGYSVPRLIKGLDADVRIEFECCRVNCWLHLEVEEKTIHIIFHSPEACRYQACNIHVHIE